jgi:hypothetical protein
MTSNFTARRDAMLTHLNKLGDDPWLPLWVVLVPTIVFYVWVASLFA